MTVSRYWGDLRLARTSPKYIVDTPMLGVNDIFGLLRCRRRPVLRHRTYRRRRDWACPRCGADIAVAGADLKIIKDNQNGPWR